MRRAFTLIELLVIVAIMGTMVTVGLVSVRAGQKSARIKGAVRDVYALMRRARSTALVTQQPAVITYDNVEVEEENCASVTIVSAKVIDTENAASDVITLTGAPLKGKEEVDTATARPVIMRKEDKSAAKSGEESAPAASTGGETLEEVLFAPVSQDVVKGVVVKALTGDAELEASGGMVQKSSISVFSTTSYLVNRLQQQKSAEAAKKQESEKKEAAAAKAVEERPAPVSIVWETNGRTDAHKVWVYPQGKRPEDGMLLKVDRFGGIKVLNGDGREDN